MSKSQGWNAFTPILFFRFSFQQTPSFSGSAVIQKGAVRPEESDRTKSGVGAKSHTMGGWFQQPRHHCG